jgi:mannosyltransferase OCH1-like enzyme
MHFMNVFQTARSKPSSPSFIDDCISSLRWSNPKRRNTFYDDDGMESLFGKSQLFTSDELSLYPVGIQHADIFRCLALYEQGGCYADVDMVGVRSIDCMIEAAGKLGLVSDDTEMIVTTDHPIHSRMFFGREKMYMNNFMLAKPGARFLKIYLEAMKEQVTNGPCLSTSPVYTTGPVAMTRLINKHGGPEALKIAVLPYHWINPLPDMTLSFPEKPYYQQMIADGSWVTEIAPYLIHYWWHSYLAEETESHYLPLLETVRQLPAFQGMDFGKSPVSSAPSEGPSFSEPLS